MASSSFDGDGPVAAINVTPLVDVMLVLLVIFMVTAPMMQEGVEVNLPKTSTGALQGASAEQVVVSVDRAGKIFLGAGNEVTAEELPPRIKAILEQRPPDQQKIYIRGDSDLVYGRMMELMGALYKGGVTQIGLISAPGTPDSGKAKGSSQR
jgi:biopolymer transport protein TolR